MPALKTHFVHPPEQKHLDYLKGKLDADVIISLGDQIPADVQVLIADRPGHEQLQNKPALFGLIIPFAGIPDETRELMTEYHKISVFNLHHNAPMTAEMALGLLIAAAKLIIPADRNLRKQDWSSRYEDNRAVVLDGKTALILGYGEIGRHVGRMCWAMGMKVIGVRRHAGAASSALVEIAPPHKLMQLLPRANILINCLPGTPDTENMITEKEIALLPRGAIVINVGRGSTINQEALYEGLKSGHLHSAGLDVWYNYPISTEARQNTPPADYPFHELDNVVMSPHRAGGGGADEVEIRRMDALAESLNAAARDKPIPNRVNIKSGY